MTSLKIRARKNTLNRVIESNGNCFIKGLCHSCPLYDKCIKNNLGIKRAHLTREQRVKEACQALLEIEINPDTLELL